MERKIAVITGSSAGVGRAAAIEFGRQGWHVALLARGLDGLDGARRDVERVGGKALVIPTDVADHAQVEAAADKVEREWGPIDVWVNDAMATIFCPLQSIAPEDFRRATDVTYLGTVWGTMAALKRMKPRNHGTIVQIGSALAYRSIPLQAPYCGAKSAIRGFTDSLRSELIHDKSQVHLTMVHLSAFNTPQFDWGRTCMQHKPKPLGKIFQPEVAARGIYWAATHRRRELWVGFPAVEAILGTRVIPGFLDRKLAFQAYDGQQSDEPIEPGRKDNLYHPVPGDHGAHGRFDRQAVTWSWELWIDIRRWVVVAGVIVLLVVLGLALAGLRA
ncbi:SDR family oxidoreductase [Noviherbaspirillum massiliense]|uniref:SDR family oxidoreductase n=1 Tax=Noviherbaspirillum massiliense TaxID=1465823 RepID=UPI00030F9EF4|nr:SDR family oxidoreductase [Noviherbaspirillum massiliense]